MGSLLQKDVNLVISAAGRSASTPAMRRVDTLPDAHTGGNKMDELDPVPESHNSIWLEEEMHRQPATWYKGFWKSDALPLGLIVLMVLIVFLIAITQKR